MRHTENRERDLETVRYFIPRCLKSVEIKKRDIISYFNWSEKGLDSQETEGFKALKEGKRWRGIHIHELYEPGILDGTVPYAILLEDTPEVIKDFLKKEMFGGIDSELIEVNWTNQNEYA